MVKRGQKSLENEGLEAVLVSGEFFGFQFFVQFSSVFSFMFSGGVFGVP